LENSYGAANAPRRNFSGRQALDRFQRDEIRKIEKALAPARPRQHQ
jgi:hypothetical protein